MLPSLATNLTLGEVWRTLGTGGSIVRNEKDSRKLGINGRFPTVRLVIIGLLPLLNSLSIKKADVGRPSRCNASSHVINAA